LKPGGTAVWARTLLLIPALLLLSVPVRAQVLPLEGPLPESVRDQVFAFLNDPTVLRLAGSVFVPADTRLEGPLAVLGGSLQVAGEISGDLLVVNGDLVLLPGSRVDGSVQVIGGRVSQEPTAELTGEAVAYVFPLRYRLADGRVQPVTEAELSPGFLASDLGFGQARFTLRAGPSYNRVEGLPVRFGPIVGTSGSNPLSLEAFGIWRSVSGLNLESDRMGYFFRLHQGIGGRGLALLGGTAYSEITAVEDRGLSNAEASLSTFLLRRDPRDHFEREGWSAFLSLHPSRIPLRAEVVYRDEDHEPAPLRNPWTLRSGDDPWRPLALPAAGRIRTLEAVLGWDSSDDPTHPSDGWMVDVRLLRQVGGTLTPPPSAPADGWQEGAVLEPEDPLALFTRGSLDVRRYARVGPTSRISLRAVLGGALTGTSLPPQYQIAHGGEGTLPGHPRFSLDCGARSQLRIAETGEGEGEARFQEVHPAYGCDRAVLFQAEFQGFLPISWNPVPTEWDDSELSAMFDLHPTWAVFLNAGQGWTAGDAPSNFARTDSATRADVGVGIFLGPLGLYWSYPLNRRDQGVNFFVRLQQRF
jgi:hypothetical protein